MGEEPWSPEKADFNAALKSSLSYQEYQGLSVKDQLYWISKSADGSCQAINAAGKIHAVECSDELPTLCTQAAPVSNGTASDSSEPWQVQQFVGNKLLTGYRDYHVWKFRGVRYADKPTRFTYSTVASFEDEGDVDATTAGADCAQPIGEVKNGSSEDCLFANVWTPYLPQSGDSKAKLKPVMLYLYGGGFTSGSGKNPNTDGTNLASRGDVVVVSVNYRVGSLGFLNLNDGVHKGNYGLSDMVTALQWVNKYIKYLGGDPDNVTLFGESAGAMSTHIVLGVPQAKGLFHRAAMQSAPDGWPGNNKLLSWPYYDSLENNYESTTKKVLDNAGCLNATDKVACLSKLSGFELVTLPTNAKYAPSPLHPPHPSLTPPSGFVMDGTYLTNHGLVVNSSALSLATTVPVLLGINRDETGVDISSSALPLPNDTFTTYLDRTATKSYGAPPNLSSLLNLSTTTFPSLSPALFNTTHPPSQMEILRATVRIATDWLFACNGFAKAYSAAKHGAFGPTYFFEFNRTYSTKGYTQPWCEPAATTAHPDGDPSSQEYLKCHAGEQMIVFGTEARGGRPERDGLDRPFMRLIVDYWAAFARNGDPNPEVGWLKARGYQETVEELGRAGKWERVVAEKPTMRVLQWGGKQVPLGEGHNEVCGGLGAPMDVLEV